MSTLEVDSVRLADLDIDLLHGRNLDSPKPGQQVAGRLLVVGWVLGHSEAAVAVEVLAEGKVIGRTSVGVQRSDLAVAFPQTPGAGAGGFRAVVTVVRAEPFVDLQVRAVLESQRRVPLATVRLKGTPPEGTTSRDQVSIVIPCYNQAHYLGDALASAAAQTHGRVEVVVVDDGSTDNTAAVTERYPGVRYVRQDNAGLAAARNTGVSHSTGEYLVFLDADDRLMPSALTVGVNALAARPGDAFVFGTWRLIGSDGSVLATPAQLNSDDPPYRALLRMCFISTPAAVMYRRWAVEAAHGFSTAVSPSADYDLYLRLTRKWPVYGHGELVAEYRRHGANMTLNRGMMLQSELAVLHGQWPHVKHDPDMLEAYGEGLRRARDYHGGRLARDVRALGATGNVRPALQGGLRLLRHHPAALVPAIRGWAEAAGDAALRLRSSSRSRLRRGSGGPAGRDRVEAGGVEEYEDGGWAAWGR